MKPRFVQSVWMTSVYACLQFGCGPEIPIFPTCFLATETTTSRP